MGKRSDFERAPRDYYPTPMSAALPLIPHLPRDVKYIEPFAGDGALIRNLSQALPESRCHWASDIDPQSNTIACADALKVPYDWGDLCITNPPWKREILHAFIQKITDDGGQCWLLFDSDWVHTKQAIPYLPRLRKIVSVGRVKWIPDSKMTGKDNCAWHCFTAPSTEPTVFYGRT